MPMTEDTQCVAQLPQVLTLAESGFHDIVFDTWQDVLKCRGVPTQALAAAHREITRALRHPEVVKSHEEQVNEVVANSPAEFERFIAEETERWRRVIGETGVRVG
jgi:tripartite-type tricarboxylate transporter receptor subunit TctC